MKIPPGITYQRIDSANRSQVPDEMCQSSIATDNRMRCRGTAAVNLPQLLTEQLA